MDLVNVGDHTISEPFPQTGQHLMRRESNRVEGLMEETRLGKIEVLPTAIASLASQVVLECYGMVGMATKDLASGIVEILQLSSHRRGVDVHIESDRIVIDLYVVIEYGTRIATVARNIQSVVKYTVEKALGVPVVAVNVHVQDLRVSAD
jgi:uncharacterized alkaline shock family protein YloU